jgi:hypothetical protein
MQRPYKDKERSTSQQTLQACFNKADADHSFDDVVDMFIHHPGLSLSLCDSPRFKKVLKLSAGASKVNFRSVRGAIIDKDEKLFAQLKAKLHGRKVGIQIDGGKTFITAGVGKVREFELVGFFDQCPHPPNPP